MRRFGLDVMSCLGQAYQGLTVGLRLLWYSVVCTVESLSLFNFLLYPNLYVLGDNVSISWGPHKRVKPSSDFLTD